MKTFNVSVIGCNADTFESKYAQYINKKVNGIMENVIFTLKAPQFVYDEIADLKQECIEIIERRLDNE